MKNLRNNKIAICAIATLALALTLGACSDNDNELPDTGNTKGGKTTLTASLGGPGTRLSHTDPTDARVKVSWTEEDEIRLFDISGSNPSILFEIDKESISDDGQSATFTGGELVDGVAYTAIGPDKAGTGTSPGILDYTGQTQDGNNSLTHLAGYDYIMATISGTERGNLKFDHYGALFQFTLTGLPAGTYKKFTIKSSEFQGIISNINFRGEDVYVQYFPVTLNNVTLDQAGTDLTVWIILPAIDEVFKAGTLTLEVTDEGGNTYTNEEAITLGLPVGYDAGKRYSMTAAMQPDQSGENNSMKFTIQPIEGNSTFTLPFETGITTGNRTLIVDWGDESPLETILPNTDTGHESLSHLYADVSKSYQITITSDAVPGERQMPKWYCYDKLSAALIKSMDSPMLNCGNDFMYAFYGCTNLTTIPANLFANNTGITKFNFCFSRCRSLATIPADLFSYTKDATSFVECFSDCRVLAEIPAGLFSENTKATDFSACFADCWYAKLSPNVFCDEDIQKEVRFLGKTVNFSQCFYYVGSEQEDGGTAPSLWEYEYGTGSYTSDATFYKCTTLSNYDDIPENWK